MRSWPVAAITLIAAGARADMIEMPPPELPVVEQTFANGLHVIIAPDANAASVVVHVRYHTAGAADDPLAHLVERLMFDGSVHVKPGEYDARIDAAGGWTGSIAAMDHLSTFEQVPAEALELVLWLEAERMAGLAGGITAASVAKEKAAIASERRAAYDDHPSGLVARAVQRGLWTGPAGNDVLADVSAATLTDVKRFGRSRIVARDTMLVIAGRVEAGQAMLLAQKYFAWIPSPVSLLPVPDVLQRGQPIEQPLTKPVELTVADAVPKVAIGFRANAAYAEDELALEVAARMLTAPRTGRLQRALVDAGLATEVHADIVRGRRGSELHFVATAAAGADLHRLGATMRDAITQLGGAAAPPDEIERAATAVEAELVANLENLAVRADALATWAIAGIGSDGLGNTRSLLRVTPDQLRAAASYWLAPAAAVTVIGR